MNLTIGVGASLSYDQEPYLTNDQKLETLQLQICAQTLAITVAST
ncbi:MAG: hypothetical protein PUP92_16150 [Rhizonema sp. PD38]|nr:hypothetical protein [Rhizonema sp. PD38]